MPIGGLIAAGVLSAGGSIAGSAIGAEASRDAGRMQAVAGQKAQNVLSDYANLAMQNFGDYTRRSQDILRDYTGQASRTISEYAGRAEDNLKPLRSAQLQGLANLQDFAAGGADSFYDQYRGNAQKNIQRQLASQGLLRSKKQADLLTNLELGIGEQQMQTRMGASQSLAGLNGLQGIANLQTQLGTGLAGLQTSLGSSLASSEAGLGTGLADIITGTGAGIANSITGVGQGAAAARLSEANAYQQGLAGFGNSIMGMAGPLAGYSQNQQIIDLYKKNPNLLARS